ncbi:serine/threonine-protein kinase [Sinosporangium siamense]|uniref:Protein kinase domain-containing protein n=1 Tax=Sinosporangium siamense TaxID=1367973 RepID=A0A919RHE6_9ACTN|nr:serine/threonine-protein kinase [Sinosporangium siamense]GII93802.1 hypothetical protein Ssi02_40330 [Sinosporangium siamense]
MPPRQGPAPYNRYPTAGPGAAHVPTRNQPWSYLWALTPLITCGLASPFIIGHAALRLRSRSAGFATGIYLVLAIVFFYVSNAYDDGDNNSTPDDPRYTMAIACWVMIGWLGGTTHALVLRKAVFPPIPVTPLPPPPPPARRQGLPGGYHSQTGPGMSSNPGLSSGPGMAGRPGMSSNPGMTGRPGMSSNPGMAGGPGMAGVPMGHTRPPQMQPPPRHSAPPPPPARQQPAPPPGANWQRHPQSNPHGHAAPPPGPPRTHPSGYGAPGSWTGPSGTVHATHPSGHSSGHRQPPPNAAPPPLGRLGPYTFTRKLGEGAQGTVYLATGPDGHPVAVKVLNRRFFGDNAACQDFLKEAEIARRVRSFSTARVIDTGMMDDVVYIVSEYVPGHSLDRLIREHGPRDGDSVTRLAVGTVAALKGIHAANVVHRDFKPANIIIGPDGPRVIDFGIAKSLDRATMTSGNIKGTLVYMSPEQINGDEVTPASDIFSWAATMIFAATGRHAFEGNSTPHIYRLIISHQPDLSILPPALRAPIHACLAKDPRHRPTAAEVMQEVTD